MAAALHQRFLATRDVLAEEQHIGNIMAAANNFLKTFLAELLGGRYIQELVSSAQMEVVFVHLSVSRSSSSPASQPASAGPAGRAGRLPLTYLPGCGRYQATSLLAAA